MKCLCCREHFVPEPQNQHHQKFCAKPGCRQASKRKSQRRWLAKPENQNYFRGSTNSDRVRAWRQKHPGYWKKRKKKPASTLQEVLPLQTAEKEPVAPPDPQEVFQRTLQDICRVQTPLLVGLIAQMIDSPLQEDIVRFVQHVVAKGNDLLDMPSRSSLNRKTYYDSKETTSTRPPAPGAAAL